MRQKGIVVIVILFLLPLYLRGQQNIVYSQYLWNGLLINPAYAGSHVQLSGTLTYRNQWVNFEGAPETATFGIHSSVMKGKVGLGALVTNDRIGSYRNTGVFLNYAYMIKDPINNGVLSMGLSLGANQYKADFTELTLKAGQDPIFNVFMNELKPNFGGGVFYYNKKIWAGFSVPTILTHGSLFSGNLEQLKTPRFYYLNAGIKLPLDRRTEKLILQPSFLIRAQEGTPLSVDYTLNLIFDQIISIGTSYRSGDGAILFLNYKLSEKFYVGYSYDYTTSDINQYSNGTHEVMINFRTRIRRIHQNLECPHVYSH
jgi:type IX secretion system PorP/SprF family membrane protein